MKKDAVKNRPTMAPSNLPPPKQGCCSAVDGLVAYATAFPGLCDDGLMGAGLIVLRSREYRMMGNGERIVLRSREYRMMGL